MLSRNKALLIIGDSNVAMIKNLFDEKRKYFPKGDVDFWSVSGSFFNRSRLNEGELHAPAKSGLEPVRIDGYKNILYCGGRVKTQAVFDEFLRPSASGKCRYPEEFIQQSIESFIPTLPGARFLQRIRAEFAGNIIAFPTPPRGNTEGVCEDTTKPKVWTEKIFDLIWTSYQSFYESCEVQLLKTPFDCTVDGKTVKAQYNIGPGDILHKNADYAELLLKEAKWA
ncbi:hypothetical protein ACEUZ9_002653 [Paracoccus litorisediminis]|uniref:Uncharacterized protein n=1 Tax=Paracoccus litorisediminis TaxID=2006130 RepID=A0A844HPB7_9RHOB|nr:hypothetical protein [Paracoccus litorisediminis]MTH60969.1 hypothetical protein [Paracoccus litorisediminis]